ncbi:protocadherin beta-14-like [Mercenaria mercenaria]|uniref:protocadherin beta-14-like n=1 Tax=Mercenaria mercenaria TaxID=6596 RepID=UPI00234FA406|nr:protocadherin beta-14-like [Mercenaria mercenaria]
MAILMIWTVSWILIGQVFTQDATVFYKIREELDVDSYIGSIGLDSNLFTNTSTDTYNDLEYRISSEMSKGATYFKIDTNGLLFIDKIIDREKFDDCDLECFLEFNVVVYELSEPTTLIQVQIEIEDLNDNAPEFLPIKSPVRVLESLDVGSVIVTGAAIDLDQGKDNYVKTYVLLPDTDIFNLTVTDNMDFEIRLTKPLDREMEPFYQVVVLAKDGGDKPLTGTVTLDIEVTDDNDNAPIFSEQLYNISVQENTAANTVILELSAVDKDENDFGKVSYKFSNRVSKKISELFQVNATSGKISTIGTIDFETDEEFNFQVVAYDHGINSKSSTASVIIKVIDINDNSPTINLNLPPGGDVLSEYAEIGTFVAHVEIMDQDSGKNGKVFCNVLDNFFRLETMHIANNYKIILNKTLDHDTKAYHNVTILCQDLGNLPRQTFSSFIIHVEDMNDNAPLFTASVYAVSVVENNNKDASIVRISATDKDSGLNGQIYYSLHAESQGLFVVNSFTGLITANVSLDRETHGEESIFRVFAIDKGKPAQTSTGTVVVNILDLNDNDPIFRNDPFKMNILESQNIGSAVGNVSARDPDAGLNGTFYLKFPEDQNVLEFFDFHESGMITTKKILDRESIAFHEFYVHAIDMGGRTSSALVIVYVTDDNDNVPEIIYPNEYDNTISIPFSLQENSEVIQIVARDYDSDENAKLYYFIDENNASYTFNIDSQSGKMFLNKTLHEKDIGHTLRFNIRVKDGGNPSLESSVEFFIKIKEGPNNETLNAGMSLNLWIVVGIVIFTAIVSVLMIIVIVKICLCNRLKATSGSTSDIIMESKEVDPRLIDSSSSASTSSKDSNGNEKIKDDSLQIQDGYQKGYFNSLDETGYLSNSSLASVDNQLYIEQVKQFGYELEKKVDETNSDNSGEIGTRDSGQGGSDVDINSLTELPVLDIAGSSTDSYLPPKYTDLHSNYTDGSVSKNNIYNDQLPPFSHQTYFDNFNSSSNNSDSSFLPQTTASFSSNPTKTAERREISKLRKSQKRVMFSDDLENSHSSERSSTLSNQSASDISHISDSRLKPRKFHRMLSEDITSSPSQLNRANDWLRRSADSFSRRPNNDKIYNQLPSNQIKFGSGRDFRNRPMGSNFKTYLDKVMEKSKSSSSSDGYLSKSSESDNVFSVDTLASESTYRDSDSITTSGTYDLINEENTLSLASPSYSNNTYARDIEI